MRIEAPFDMRVNMTMERLGCDEKGAHDYIADADQERVKWARFMYGKDIRDPLLYDLNINLGHMTIKAACRMLESIMGEEEFQATTGLLEYAATTHSLAKQRIGMAKEQTGLVREQTRLSTRSTELSNIRTELSHERTSLGGQRTDFSALRTQLAGKRTVFSNMHTELARGRTHLALIRTGLAFFRIFGLSWWSIFDGLLGIGSLIMTAVGLTGYWRATHLVRSLQSQVPAEEGGVPV